MTVLLLAPVAVKAVVRATPGVRAAAICPASVLTAPAMDPALAEAGVMRMTGRP
jgi:hypothetical protein